MDCNKYVGLVRVEGGCVCGMNCYICAKRGKTVVFTRGSRVKKHMMDFHNIMMIIPENLSKIQSVSEISGKLVVDPKKGKEDTSSANKVKKDTSAAKKRNKESATEVPATGKGHKKIRMNVLPDSYPEIPPTYSIPSVDSTWTSSSEENMVNPIQSMSHQFNNEVQGETSQLVSAINSALDDNQTWSADYINSLVTNYNAPCTLPNIIPASSLDSNSVPIHISRKVIQPPITTSSKSFIQSDINVKDYAAVTSCMGFTTMSDHKMKAAAATSTLDTHIIQALSIPSSASSALPVSMYDQLSEDGHNQLCTAILNQLALIQPPWSLNAVLPLIQPYFTQTDPSLLRLYTRMGIMAHKTCARRLYNRSVELGTYFVPLDVFSTAQFLN